MSFWDRLRDAFRPRPVTPHPALVALRARRDAYVSVVRETAVTRAVLDAARARAEDVGAAASLWEKRAEEALPDDLREAVRTLATRLRASAEAAEALAEQAARSLSEAEDDIAVMAADDLRLMQRARSLGLDVRDLTVEMDLGELRRQAEDRLLSALAAAGALEPDEDREFLEKLFEKRLTRPAPLHS